MANGTGLPNLSDYAKSIDPNGDVVPAVDRLAEENEIINDMPVIEGNLDTGDVYLASTERPAASKRRVNSGVEATKGKNEQIVEGYAHYEQRSIVDKRLVPAQAKIEDFRAQELGKSISALGEGMSGEIFYGDAKEDPDAFNGFAVRYSDPKKAGRTLIDGKGTGTHLTSIYLVCWDKEVGAYGFVPKGAKVGINVTDLTPGNKPHKIEDAKKPGAAFLGYETFVEWDQGIGVKDLRFCSRIANLDLDSISDAELLKLLRRATNMVQTLNKGKFCWYMNRWATDRVEGALDAKNNVQFTNESPSLLKLRTLHRIPLRMCDAIKGGAAEREGETLVKFN
ncbi:hypothetical protein AAIR98_001437 [Elusimicrobium simillimum]|uniref:major capsid protein n=1 Tax=Elusimicrobium simillimum TaxID=3143438 RepID=UPI003C6F2E3B